MTVEFLGLEDLIPPEITNQLSNSAVMEILQDIADGARYEWIRIAKAELFSSRRDYIAGIQKVHYTLGTATITLAGVLPNVIEKNQDEYDMHDTLLGPNVPTVPLGQRGKHKSKDGGFYRAVPFRHQTPTGGGAAGAPMGRPYRKHDIVQDAKKLGRAVYRAAKKLEPSTSMPGQGMVYAGRLKTTQEKKGKGLFVPKLRPYHATDIYSGMIKAQKFYKEVAQHHYMTFRTIAVDANEEPKGSSPWIRPERKGKHFAKRVNQYVQKIAPAAFTAYLEQK